MIAAPMIAALMIVALRIPSNEPLVPDLALERARGMGEGRWVAGIDEVGRGPIAGPVLAAAVVFDPSTADLPFARHVRDSKQLSPQARETLATAIISTAFAALGAASVGEIARLNILQASLLAMERAWSRLVALSLPTGMPCYCLVDGTHAPRLAGLAPSQVEPLVRGDARSLSIACASIVAKVARDRLMQRLHRRYSAYDWHSNKGYPTPFHLDALQRAGLSPHHRRGFAPCANLRSE